MPKCERCTRSAKWRLVVRQTDALPDLETRPTELRANACKKHRTAVLGDLKCEARKLHIIGSVEEKRIKRKRKK